MMWLVGGVPVRLLTWKVSYEVCDELWEMITTL